MQMIRLVAMEIKEWSKTEVQPLKDRLAGGMDYTDRNFWKDRSYASNGHLSGSISPPAAAKYSLDGDIFYLILLRKIR